eukprot:IDg7005t1
MARTAVAMKFSSWWLPSYAIHLKIG